MTTAVAAATADRSRIERRRESQMDWRTNSSTIRNAITPNRPIRHSVDCIRRILDGWRVRVPDP